MRRLSLSTVAPVQSCNFIEIYYVISLFYDVMAMEGYRAVWTKMMQASAAGADFKTDCIGISYMLQGDEMPTSATQTPPPPTRKTVMCG